VQAPQEQRNPTHQIEKYDASHFNQTSSIAALFAPGVLGVD
jgi:hypothetical protein